MARVVRISDLVNMHPPVMVWTANTKNQIPNTKDPNTQAAVGLRGEDEDEEDRNENKVSARADESFFMGQVVAVVGMARTNMLSNRAALKQLEKIVHNYGQERKQTSEHEHKDGNDGGSGGSKH